MAHRRRNSISPEYREELLATGIQVPLDVNAAFRPSLMRVLDELERSADSVVAFLVTTGRVSGEIGDFLVLPDQDTARRVRTAAAFLAGDRQQDMNVRVRAMDLVNLIEAATRIDRIELKREPDPLPPPTTTALAAWRPSSCGLMKAPGAGARRRSMRLLTDAHGDSMRGLFGKFPSAFKRGYAMGWEQFEDDFGYDEGDQWGRHIEALMHGFHEFGAILDKAGFEVQIYDVCGCGDPLHYATCFRRPGDASVLAVRIWPGLWMTDASSHAMNDELCEDLALGDMKLPDDAWEVIELQDMSDEDWQAALDGLYNNPPRSITDPKNHLSHGFYMVSEKTAQQLARSARKQVSPREKRPWLRSPRDRTMLPSAGFELMVEHDGKNYWLAQTPHERRMVWSVREA